nr:metastasis suppressor protein 1 [Hymenolepis microstoma]
MKPSYEANNFSVKLSNLKTSLAYWDELINKSNKLTTSMSVTMQCMSGFLEAFQKIADIAETNDAGLRPFGIALRRYCLRQLSIESRLRSFNSQITDCLVTPLSDRLEEWRRTSNQMDRDSVKELRKARSELQRAMLEAEKCKKRIKRKDRGGVTVAFEKDDYDAPSVQINFVQHDLACKQRALEQLEQRCLQSVAEEERRRFAELATCLSPLVDAHLNVLAEMGSLEEVLKEIQASHSEVIASVTDSNATPIPTDTSSDGTFRLLSTPFVKSNGQTTTNGSATVTASNHQNIPLDPTIATGSAALPYAVAPAPSTLSITSNSINGGGSLLFGHTDSISTLHSPDDDAINRGIHHPSIPPQPASAGLGCAGSPETGPESLMNGGGGDALSLFDHNQSISGAPTVLSASSSSSLGLLPINCDAASGLGSLGDSGSSNGMGPVNGVAVNGEHHAATNASDYGSDEDGGTTEGCLTEDDENDETLGQSDHNIDISVTNTAHSTNMEKSVLYPNQALPPPVYTNIGKLQAAAQRGVGGIKTDASSSNTVTGSSVVSASNGTTKPHRAESPPIYDTHQSDGRKFSQPTATISKGGMATLLRSLSISGRPPGLASSNPLSSQSQQAPCEGAGEGLGLSPPHTSYMTPVIADQATTSPPPESSTPNSPSSSYAEARSRIDAIFSGHRTDSPQPPTNSSSIDPLGVEGLDLSGVGNTSTFRRRRLPQFQQQSQTLTRTAGINLMRGSMFQLNTASTSAPVAASNNGSVDMEGRSGYGYGPRQTPMTPGPNRRCPLRNQLSNTNDPGGQVIRPPRRSSSVCRELPSLSQQQPSTQLHHLQQAASQQPQQNFFPTSGYLQHQQHIDNCEPGQQQPQARQQQLSLSSNGHYTTPRGVQQHPQRVYADPRSFQHQQSSQNGGSNSPSVGTAAQLAVEAAARRNQQYASTSGVRNPSALVQRTLSPNQNGTGASSRLPQRQVVGNGSGAGTSNGNSSVRAVKNQRTYYSQQQQHQQSNQTQSNIPAMGYGYGYPSAQQNQQYSHHHLSQQNLNYLHQQNNRDFPPPPAAFDDVESTSFIEPLPPPSQ